VQSRIIANHFANLREYNDSRDQEPSTVTSSLSSGLNSLGSSQVVDKVTLGLEVLNVSTVLQDLLVGLEGFVLGSVERSESPLLGNDDSLLTGDCGKQAVRNTHCHP
jgi:hypothetical protein